MQGFSSFGGMMVVYNSGNVRFGSFDDFRPTLCPIGGTL
jgi:hypothetical protein